MGPDCNIYTQAAQFNGCIGGYVLVCGIVPLVAIVFSGFAAVDAWKKDRAAREEYDQPEFTEIQTSVTELPTAQPGASLSWGMDFSGLTDEAKQMHEPRWLPLNCSACGGPVDPARVKWVGRTRAKCEYCGTIIGH